MFVYEAVCISGTVFLCLAFRVNFHLYFRSSADILPFQYPTDVDVICCYAIDQPA